MIIFSIKDSGIFANMRNALLILVFTYNISFAQVNVKDSLQSVSIIGIGGGFNIPDGDLKNRFGYFTSIHGIYLRKQASGLMWGCDLIFYFGNKFKEGNILQSISTPQGYIIGGNGTLYEPQFFMRGFSTTLKMGKLFPIIGPNKNSGLFVLGGIGFLQHKIRIETERNAFIPALTKEYLKGYDKLTNGILFQPVIGYLHLSNNRLFNFSLFIEYSFAFTQNRRSYNFEDLKADSKKRNDRILSIRLNWELPIYKKKANDFYYF
jgi:hypothetical protein